jgi:hypothetical protein
MMPEGKIMGAAQRPGGSRRGVGDFRDAGCCVATSLEGRGRADA